MFDKTGTVTHGVPRVARVAMFVENSICSFVKLIAIAGTAENSSEHPLASAIVKYAKQVGWGGLQMDFNNIHGRHLLSMYIYIYISLRI